MKLGPHVIIPTEAALRWARVAPIVKAINDPTPLQQAPDRAIRVFRYYFPEQRFDADPRDVAHQIVGALRGYRHPLLYVEIYNGFNPTRSMSPSPGM